MELGPGFLRGTAKVAGIAVVTDNFADYFPIGHTHGGNLARNIVVEWLNDQIRGADELQFTNASYDMEGLDSLGVRVTGKRIIDTMVPAALLDEEADGYSLEKQSKRILGKSKDERLLVEAGKAHGLYKIKQQMTLLPAKFVAPYAIEDAKLNMELIDAYMPIIDKEDLRQVFEMETKVTEIFFRMRRQGIPVDLKRAEQLSAIFKKQEREYLDELKLVTGTTNPEPLSPTWLKRVYDDADIELPKTANGNDSVVASWLEKREDPLSKLILKWRKVRKMRSEFVDRDMFKLAVNGRIHPEYHQLASDDGGTRTGRISMSLPNPQQIPARDEYFGPLIRSLYAAPSPLRWVCADYSQQEPRLLMHYADLMNLPGARDAADRIRKNPRIDFHQMTTDICNEVTRKNFKRKQIKGVNLGIMYSMGIDKLARQLGVTREEAVVIMKDYDGALPFVKALSRKAMDQALNKGIIRTLLRRVRHFKHWEPVFSREEREDGMRGRAYEYAEALAKYPDRGLQRAFSHKALNSLIQGSAADMTKQAIILLDQVGILPYIQVHDELDMGLEHDKEIAEAQEVMQNAVNLTVPVVCDVEVGDPTKGDAGTSNWGFLSEWKMAA